MSDREEWGEWRDHSGDGCPLRMGQVAEFIHEAADGTIEQAVCRCTPKVAEHPSWNKWMFRQTVCINGSFWVVGRITRYRLRKPRALQQLREMIETLPAPRQKEDTHV